MSRQAQSGLKTIKRDWSAASCQPPIPQSSQEIPWDPTPPKPTATKPISQPLTGTQQRLKDIQDALAGKSVSSERSQPLVSSNSLNKRPSPTPASDANPAPAPKKPRQLPPSWKESSSGLLTSSTWGPGAATSSRSIATSKSTATILPPVSTSSSKTKVASVFLSQEQTQILKLVQEGDSVFYTGSAGTGKSVLLREIIKTLRKKHVKSPDAVAITASTGIAACNIGGVTIHSFAGIGLGIEDAEHLASKVRKNKKASARWLRTKVLIIDEVSMVDGDLFDKLARVGSLLRKNVEPFGGIQVIVTGDFFQLPPVTKGSAQVKFAFEAQLWNQTIKRTFNLTKVFRQRDQDFVDMLNEMRFGRLSSSSIAKFKALSRDIEYEDGLGATELFPRREDVDRSNSTRMTRLNTDQQRYKSLDGGTIQDMNQREKMLANFMAPEVLELRVDAQVMLIKNTDDMLVNGSMGRVVRFVDPAIYGTEADIGGGHGPLGGTVVSAAGGGAREGKKGAVVGTGIVYPLVEFLLPHGGRREVLITPEAWKVELPNGEIQVSRSQLPLILAWAMSIHKSQGQTLERVKVDLGKVFEKGQAYVALSRATSLEGLQVLNFDPNKVNAHPKVAQWSKTLETVSEYE